MKNVLFGFVLAIQFLTRIPTPINSPWNEQTSRWAIRCYPLVGILLGTILYGVGMMLGPFVPLVVLALLLLTVWVWLTGGLHLDGVMDVADAVGSNAPLKKKWEIMKDPHVGSFGMITLFFLLIWKAVFIYLFLDMSPYSNFLSLLIILAIARFGCVALLVNLPAAKKQGLAWEWKKNITNIDVVISFVPIAILFVFQPEMLVIIPVYILFVATYSLWLMRTFKGINGDLLGTAIEGGELWGLIIIWIYFSFVMG